MNSEVGIPTTGDPAALLGTLSAELQDLATAKADDARLAQLVLEMEMEVAAARAKSDPYTVFSRVDSASPGDHQPLSKAVRGRTVSPGCEVQVKICFLVSLAPVVVPADSTR